MRHSRSTSSWPRRDTRRILGHEVLRQGGNAIDAAIATAFALAVTLPEAGNIGGGGFIVAYLADRREVITVDFRETAPQAAAPKMYLDREGKLRPRHRAGAWAAGVPGTVRGLGLAHSRWGKRPWSDLVRPAARLAREGFPISADLAGSLNSQLKARALVQGKPARRLRPAGRLSGVGGGIRPARQEPVEGRRPADRSPTWPRRWNGLPPAEPTSSTQGGLPSSSPGTWRKTTV